MTEIADGGEILSSNKPVSFDRPMVIVLILVSVLILAIGIGVSFAIFYPRKNTVVVVDTTKTNLVDNIPQKVPSKLASDSGFLKLKSDIDGFASELDQIDLVEPQLAPPNIDLNISVQIK